MIDIKFRGKKTNELWVYGYYKYTKILSEHIIISDDFYISHTVIPETVGQFTGLYDMKNKEIYKGDILKVEMYCGKYENYEVVWDLENASFDAINKSNFISPSYWKFCEVVGNIYDK